MNDTPNRRGRRAAAATATAPMAPAIAASAERAAIERDPTTDAAAAGAPVGVDPAPYVPAGALPADDTAVLPEPTLVAEPGRAAPIVTASPPLAAEPSAMDVVQADAAADRVAAGVATDADREGPNFAAAGQPTLAIERAAGAVANGDGVDGMRRDVLGARDVLDPLNGAGHGRQMTDGFVVLSLEEVIHGLEHLAETDQIGMDIIRTRFFADEQDAGPAPFQAQPAVETVTVIEVVGPSQGRRRAGFSFGTTPRRFLASDLRADELDALRSDRLLTVGISEMDAAEAGVALADTLPAPMG